MTTFDAIRAAMAAKSATVTATVSNATASATTKVVETAKVVTSAVGSVMPVTNAKLDDRSAKILAIIEEQGLQLDALYAHLNVAKPVVQATDISALVALRMESIKAKPVQEEVPVAPAVQQLPAPQPEVVAPAPVVVPEATQEAVQRFVNFLIEPMPKAQTPVTQAPAKPQEDKAKSFQSANPMGAGLSMGQPSNWHMV